MLKEVYGEGSPAWEAYRQRIPVQRFGTPDDIANGVAFLMDDRSSFVTGQVLFICGGVTIGRANAT
jgi:NAD(P)-dependent dehydrogenase (short-subunit alcohol dehydrogenase family)